MASAPSSPKVMIVGAGIGGLTLAILLEKAGIEYEVYERNTILRPLGSATSLSPNVLPLFEQLGILPELEAISKPAPHLDIYKETPVPPKSSGSSSDGNQYDLEKIGDTDVSA